MPQIVYVGPFDEVDVPAYRLHAVNGEPVEVSDELADSLLEQTDNWQPASRPASQPATPFVPLIPATPTAGDTSTAQEG